MKPGRQRVPQTPSGAESSQSRTLWSRTWYRQSQRDNWPRDQPGEVWRLDLPGSTQVDRVIVFQEIRVKTRWKNRKLRVIVDRKTKTVPLTRDDVDLTRNGARGTRGAPGHGRVGAEDREAGSCPAPREGADTGEENVLS